MGNWISHPQRGLGIYIGNVAVTEFEKTPNRRPERQRPDRCGRGMTMHALLRKSDPSAPAYGVVKRGMMYQIGPGIPNTQCPLSSRATLLSHATKIIFHQNSRFSETCSKISGSPNFLLPRRVVVCGTARACKLATGPEPGGAWGFGGARGADPEFCSHPCRIAKVAVESQRLACVRSQGSGRGRYTFDWNVDGTLHNL